MNVVMDAQKKQSNAIDYIIQQQKKHEVLLKEIGMQQDRLRYTTREIARFGAGDMINPLLHSTSESDTESSESAPETEKFSLLGDTQGCCE